jgi:hypothetical protein
MAIESVEAELKDLAREFIWKGLEKSQRISEYHIQWSDQDSNRTPVDCSSETLPLLTSFNGMIWGTISGFP